MITTPSYTTPPDATGVQPGLKLVVALRALTSAWPGRVDNDPARCVDVAARRVRATSTPRDAANSYRSDW
jgi:hypothetical protein